MMFKRQTSGSTVCASCGSLVGVKDDRCYSCGRRNPALWGYAPLVRSLGRDLGFVNVITAGSVVMFAISLLLSGGDIGMRGGLFGLLSPSTEGLFLLGASGAVPFFRFDRWWTVLSAGWLHGGLLHIFFNMMWVRQLAPATAELFGPGRLVIIYTIGGVAGFLASSLAGQYLGWMPLPMLRGAGFTVGASAPVFGLLGALVLYGRRTGSSAVHGQAMSWALMMFVFGLIMPGVDNYAHGGGFVGGYLAAQVLDPLKPERVNHLAIALGCFVATLLAIIVSVIHGMALFGV